MSQTQTATTYEPMSPVQDISTPHLTDEESASLLDCINDVRAGEAQYMVLLTNRKVTNTPKRLPGRDYVEHPALRGDAHLGWLMQAPNNKKTGLVYLHVAGDESRRSEKNPDGHTRITLEGIRSFAVLGEQAGPLAVEPQAEPQLQQEAPQPAPQPVDPRLVMAQALFLQGQALIQMAQALTMQAAQQPA